MLNMNHEPTVGGIAVAVAYAPKFSVFKTEKSRQIVKGLVDAIVETTSQVKMSEREMHLTALMLIRGARIATEYDPDVHQHVSELLAALTAGGVEAVCELVEVVAGQELHS